MTTEILALLAAFIGGTFACMWIRERRLRQRASATIRAKNEGAVAEQARRRAGGKHARAVQLREETALRDRMTAKLRGLA